jgi:hypothetical protein
LNKSENNKILTGCNWAEIALDPDAQCGRGPRPREARPARAALLGEPATTRRRRTGDGGERRLTGVEMAARRDGDGRVAKEAVGTGGGGPGDGTIGEAVGATAARVRRSGGGRERGRLSGRAARCPDSGFKPRRLRGAWQPRGNGALPRRPGAASDRWGPLVSDFQIKNHPERK